MPGPTSVVPHTSNNKNGSNSTSKRPRSQKGGDQSTGTQSTQNSPAQPGGQPETANATGSTTASAKRRGRGSRGRGRGPRWVPVQNATGIDRNNEETFASNENWTEEWSQQRSLVDAFEQFKRQQVTTHKAGVNSIAVKETNGQQTQSASETPLDPTVVAFDVNSSTHFAGESGENTANQDLLQQILEATDIFGWNSPDNNAFNQTHNSSSHSVEPSSTNNLFPISNDCRPPPRWATTHPPSPSSKWSVARASSLPLNIVTTANDLLPPLTRQHKHVLMEAPGRPVPWPQPNTTSSEARVSWMSQNELETVLRLQLMHMEKANQVLTRPQTLRLDSELSSLGHVTSSSTPERDYLWSAQTPDLARRSLLCECVLARHLEADIFQRGPCPLSGTDLCIMESSYLDIMYLIEEGFQAYLHYKYLMLSHPILDREIIEEADNALNIAVRICLDSDTPPMSIDRSCRRLMLLADHPKGLRLLSLVFSSLITAPLGTSTLESGTAIWLLTAFLRNFRLLAAICRAGTHSRDFAFLIPLLRHSIDHRSVIPVSGPESLGCLVKDFCWEQLAALMDSSSHENYLLFSTGDVSTEFEHPMMSISAEAIHLKRIWFCILLTLAKQVESQRCSMLPYLLRNLILGYFQFLISYNLTWTEVQASLYVPNTQAVAALTDPGLSVVFTLLLLLIQDPNQIPNACLSFSQSYAAVAKVLEASPLETAGYKFDDPTIIFVGVALILRAAVERCVQTPNLLEAGYEDVIPAVRVLAVLPSINIVFQSIRLALNSDVFSALLKTTFTVSGSVVENCLVRLHGLFPGR